MSPPLVSVLIPCHNAERYVGEAIDSALAQTHPSVEVVVVDDGSTDRSADVVRRFGDRIVFEGGPNRGACQARNRALALSNGEYVQFLDADDLLMPHKVERQLPALERGEADLVACRGYVFGDGKPERETKKRIPPPQPDDDPFGYCLNWPLGTEGPLHRRACLEAVGGFRDPVRRAQEVDLHLRLTAAGARLAYVDEPLFRHRDHDGPRISRQPQPQHWRLGLYLELADLLGRPPYDLTPARREAFAEILHYQAVFAYRAGEADLADRGFAAARRLAPGYGYVRGRWPRLATRLFGSAGVERLRAVGRRVLGRRPAGAGRR